MFPLKIKKESSAGVMYINGCVCAPHVHHYKISVLLL